MNFEQVCVKLFDYIYQKVYRGTHFKLDLSISNQKKILENFNKLVCNHLNMPEGYIPINYLIDYYCYSFSIFANKDLKRKISMNWIIGKKTFKKWKEKKEEQMYYVDKFITEYNINIDDLRSSLHEGKEPDNVDQTEEIEKLRFHGEARLYNCIQNTTLYNHRSINCIGCENRTVCKKLLKTKFPKTYKKRGYE